MPLNAPHRRLSVLARLPIFAPGARGPGGTNDGERQVGGEGRSCGDGDVAGVRMWWQQGRPDITILAGDPIHAPAGKPTIAAARELTNRIETAIEEMRRPYGPPAHAWFDERAA